MPSTILVGAAAASQSISAALNGLSATSPWRLPLTGHGLRLRWLTGATARLRKVCRFSLTRGACAVQAQSGVCWGAPSRSPILTARPRAAAPLLCYLALSRYHGAVAFTPFGHSLVSLFAVQPSLSFTNT